MPETSPVFAVPFGPRTVADLGLADSATQDETAPDADSDSSEATPDLVRGTTPDGEACESNSDCQSAHCISAEEGFPEGMCSPYPCGPEIECSGGDPICFQPPDNEAFCSRRCTGNSECRNQYECEFIAGMGFGACIPSPPATNLPDGEACVEDEQCRGGVCFLTPEWPGGYCSTLNCTSFEDCASNGEDNRCLISQTGGANVCVRICQSTAECRSRYVCQPVGDDLGYCAPDPNRPIEVDSDTSPLGFSCDVDQVSFDTKRLGFAIPEEATSYMVVPVALDGHRLQPNRIRAPGEKPDIDFVRGENSRQTATAQILGFTSPIVIPFIPDLEDQLYVGNHDFDIETSSTSLCHYLLIESSVGTTIDLNVYLVGVPDVRAEIANGDLNIAETLDAFEETFALLDVEIGQVRFFDADEDTVDRFSIIRSDNDLYLLNATSAPPGDELDDHLSTNLFLVRDIQMGGAIGVSAGLPGPAGLHSTGGSGVVLTTSALGEGSGGNLLTAQIMAHEVGHYLGLWHTTELNGRGVDPLDDTPECQTDQLQDCPDFNNLMFPTAGGDHVELSDGQMFMLLMNPLTKD
jgi:hypothetical protein